jgi:hypothetical protein
MLARVASLLRADSPSMGSQESFAPRHQRRGTQADVRQQGSHADRYRAALIGFHMPRIKTSDVTADPIRRGGHQDASFQIPHAVATNPANTKRARIQISRPRLAARRGSPVGGFQAGRGLPFPASVAHVGKNHTMWPRPCIATKMAAASLILSSFRGATREPCCMAPTWRLSPDREPDHGRSTRARGSFGLPPISRPPELTTA